MTTFAYLPDPGMPEAHEPKRRAVRFGDGYQQTSPTGLNADLGKWDLTFSGRSLTEADAIMTLCKVSGAGGTVPLTWTPPGESTAIKVLAYPYKKVWTGINSYTVTLTFEQVP
jgi:phage-related protein